VKFSRFDDAIAVETEVPAYVIPCVGRIQTHVYGSVLKVSRRSIVSSFSISKRNELINLTLPNKWECLEAIFSSAGFRCEPSDKGRLALGVTKLLGGVAMLQILGSSRIYALLEGMSRLKKSNFGDPETRSFQVSDAKPLLGTIEATRVVMKWLLKQGVIFRGASLTCPNCQLTQWNPVDQLSSATYRCSGCFEQAEPPLDVDNVQWSYKANQLIARAFEQGVMPHLLTIFASWHPWSFGGQTLGFFPGVDLSWTGSAASPIGRRQAELDFLEICDGRLIVGECKVDGNRITAKEIDLYMSLARVLDCSKVVFSTCTELTEETKRTIEARTKGTSAEVELMNLRETEDVRAVDRQSREDTIDSKKPAAYLSYLVARYMTD